MPTLNWIGKEAVINHHKEVPFRLLDCNLTRSVGEPNGNLLIEGDNLEALKALLPYYAGQVKCIYIDPPYNTGNENWVYNDSVNSTQIRAWLGKVVGGEGEDLSRHDKWLCMMYPRLRLLRELLREDGVIFISIGDDEVHNLRHIMDEIFGSNNLVADIVWQARKSVSSDTLISLSHHHTIFYARNKRLVDERKQEFRFPLDREKFSNPDNDPRGPWTADPFDAPEIRENLSYPIRNPNTGQIYYPPPGRHWRLTQDQYEALLADNRIVFGRAGRSKPQLKRFLREVEERGQAPTTWWDDASTTTEGTRLLQRIMGGKVFDNPKPVELIRRIVELSTGKDDIVLDSFAGSGTTGHAVLQLNKEDGGDRRFILVELEPPIARTVAAERLRRVIQGYTWTDQRGNEHHEEGLGSGFRYCTLGATIFHPDGAIHDAVTWEDLARHIWFTETRNPWPGLPSPSEGEGPGVRVATCLGSFNGVAYYLYFNGIGGNVFGPAQLAELPLDETPKVVYADTVAVEPAELDEHKVTFKQIPYDVKVY